ncbi:hypothetical protein FPRO04_13663 [Fusarium proliferatum]|nr:hypothetical protein FPRO04_13663 [Fusarium proliferatum]
MATETKTHNDYTVGWVCALPKERAAAAAMLDQIHGNLPKPKGDSNTYTLGSIGKHNVVIACLPKGQYGNNPAATVATQMIRTFQSIKLGLMVGIGGGVPPKVRLGDVVISTPLGQCPGVIQWDMGKAKEGGKFERTGALNNPPGALLTALTALEAQYDMEGSKVSDYLDELKQKWPNMAKKYLRSDSLKDVLFRADYAHVSETAVDQDANEGENGNDAEEAEDEIEEDTDEEDESCRHCDKNKVVKRKPRRKMRVHYGLIASGNQVIKSATFRDQLKKDLGVNVLCVEMEAAGLMNNFPCIVIRGICDYADSHKNKAWQKHAAAVAAAAAKELLSHLQPSEVDGEPRVRDVLNEFKQVRQCLQNVAKGVIETNQGLDNLRGEQELRKKNSILDWLSSVNYSLQQTDYITQREPGTAQWLLNSTKFQSWLETRKQTLFCPGIPGAGKTIQTSVVVQDLCTRFYNDNTVGIAYLYCNFQRQEDQKIEYLLANLLKQLAKWRNPLPDSVIALYDRHQNRDTRPLREDISETLNSVALTYVRVFIVVDALDECQESSRTNLLNELFRLQKKTGMSLLATSRMIPEIEKKFDGCLSLEIRPKAAIDGVFLLAKLYLDSLVGKRSPTALRKALKSLREASQASKDKSRALYGAYEKAMERIRLQLGDLPRDATLTLSWIVHAKRRLEVPELQHALAVEIGTDELDNGNIPTVEHIIQAYAPLVTIDKESNIIRLVHYTLQEFFEQEQNIWLPDAQAHITRVCVTYLSFSVFESGFCETDKEFEERLQSHPLSNYAAHNWGHHARESLLLCWEAMDFLKCETKVEASSQVLMAVKRYSWSSDYCQRVPKQMTGLHLAAYFGVGMAVEAILTEHCSDPMDSYSRTPLWWAARNGHGAVVKAFLDKGANMESKDKYDGRTPLSWAATNGHEAVVRLLLEKGAVAESKDKYHGRWVSDNGHKPSEDDGTEPKYDKQGRTPLSWAAENGHEAVIKVLLNNDADVESKDAYGRTPLSLAAERGRWAVVKVLLDKDADVESKDQDGRTPLWCAVENGHEAVVRLLLENGAEIKSKDKGGRTLLSWAATNGHEGVVRLLLQNGAEIESKDKDAWTPLWWAVENGHEAVVRLLLENGAEIKSKDKGGRTLLSWAARNGHKVIVKILLENGAEIEWKDKGGRTPLWWASQNRHKEVAKLLLESAAERESIHTKVGRTPLSNGC